MTAPSSVLPMPRPAYAIRWYHAALALFTIGAIAGLLFSMLAPLAALSVYGLGIVALSALGFAASLAGLRLEGPHLLRGLATRLLAPLRGADQAGSPFGQRALEAPRIG